MTSTPCATRPLITRATAFSLPGMVRDGKDHAIAARQRDFRMLVLGDARQRRARLALAAGAQRQHLVGRQIAVALDAAEILHAVEIAGLARDLRPPAPWRGRPGRLRARRRARRRRPRGCGRHGRRTSSRRRGAGAVRISSAKVLATSASEGERPSRTALVESPTSASTPSSPSAVSFASSVGAPTSGVGSIFQSPVCSTVPAGVRIASAFDSGIE